MIEAGAVAVGEIQRAEKERIRKRCMWWLKGWGRKQDKMGLGDNCAKIHFKCVKAVERARKEFPPQ